MLPVVHEDVRSPNFVGCYSEVLDSSKFGFVPPEVVVVPLLRWTQIRDSVTAEVATFITAAAICNAQYIKKTIVMGLIRKDKE